MTPEEAYERLAPEFRVCSRRSAAYLEAVDRVLASRLPKGARSLLDVGSGDGGRAVGLARTCGIETVVLVEPSPTLRARCREQPVSEVWAARAEELEAGSRRFDVVTCLWNVLGHVPTREARLRALRGMRRSLNEGGVLFLDVQNRYNARAYGPFRTAGRWLFDRLRPSESRGDVIVTWKIGDETVRFPGHVFTPAEGERLFREAGLVVRRRDVVDYRTGTLRRFACEGQLLYELAPSADAPSGGSVASP